MAYFSKKKKTYEAYSNFDQVTRDDSVPMTDFITGFEQRYLQMNKYTMELPNPVLAFKWLDTKCLDVKDQQH